MRLRDSDMRLLEKLGLSTIELGLDASASSTLGRPVRDHCLVELYSELLRRFHFPKEMARPARYWSAWEMYFLLRDHQKVAGLARDGQSRRSKLDGKYKREAQRRSIASLALLSRDFGYGQSHPWHHVQGTITPPPQSTSTSTIQACVAFE